MAQPLTEYDVSLAARALALLRPPDSGASESNTEERQAKIWEPLWTFLRELAATESKALLCVASPPLPFPEGSAGKFRDIFCICNKKVAYLTTVFSQAAETAYRQQCVQLYRDTQQHYIAEQLLQQPLTAIIKDRLFLRTAVVTENLTEPILGKAVQRLLTELVPSLATRKVIWLPTPASETLDNLILHHAEAIARQRPRQSITERDQAMLQDEFRL